MLRILIVDDHPDTAEAIGMLLDAIGHETKVARTGADGIAAAEMYKPHLVILDIGLPDISGYEVARSIRALPCGAGIHLVAATGWGAAEDRVRALAAGFDQHQLKPLDLGKLQMMLTRATERVTSLDLGGASSRA